MCRYVTRIKLEQALGDFIHRVLSTTLRWSRHVVAPFSNLNIQASSSYLISEVILYVQLFENLVIIYMILS